MNQLLANNSQYAKSFDKPMTLGVKKRVGELGRQGSWSLNDPGRWLPLGVELIACRLHLICVNSSLEGQA